ncbi:MAG TPA: D-cysteine desulfhydrase family protein [Candidatus Polarisedimenticolia bacterium]|nr:D-cysteine desulfhydrase family protein [Candidatus Polarisedimenticolia bacterium]
MPGPARLRLAHLPTPLEEAARFAADLGGARVWIKRDDCTGLAFGGNKARKLEYLMAAAAAAGADVVVTFGGVQSNHTRSTAAAARRLGMGCHLILAGSLPGEATGNLLLDRVLGATLTFLGLSPAELTPARVQDAFDAVCGDLRGEARRPFVIGPGGSTPLGALAYATAFDELMSQAREAGARVTELVVAFGTGGTLAGLVLGNVLAGRPVRVTGISVAPPGMPESLGVPPVDALVAGAASLIGREAPLAPGDIRVLYDYSGPSYAAPTPGGLEAIHRLARTEGIFLEPVYTGKAMAGLADLCRRGAFARDAGVVFVHTGGTPALFAYGRSF